MPAPAMVINLRPPRENWGGVVFPLAEAEARAAALHRAFTVIRREALIRAHALRAAPWEGYG